MMLSSARIPGKGISVVHFLRKGLINDSIAVMEYLPVKACQCAERTFDQTSYSLPFDDSETHFHSCSDEQNRKILETELCVLGAHMNMEFPTHSLDRP